jgi:hypothetical protein
MILKCDQAAIPSAQAATCFAPLQSLRDPYMHGASLSQNQLAAWRLLFTMHHLLCPAESIGFSRTWSMAVGAQGLSRHSLSRFAPYGIPRSLEPRPITIVHFIRGRSTHRSRTETRRATMKSEKTKSTEKPASQSTKPVKEPKE